MDPKTFKTFDLSDVDGFGPALCTRVRNTFAREEWRKAPYRLTECRGVGFIRADRVAKRLGIEGKDKERINAGAEHLLTEAELGGHTCLPTTEFAPDLLKLLDIHLMDFEFDDRFYEGEGLIGLRRTFEAEAAVAAQTCILTSMTVAPRRPFDLMDLKRDQADALAVMNNANMFVLLGGPGTGKTHLIRRLAQCTSGKVALCAPTGKAAKRIEELTGIEAKTIHRLLQPADKLKNKTSFSRGFNFMRNRLKPLDADLVIMDEASMCDVKLLADLMDALPIGCRLILVGDPFQLPSVGPGAVLRDLVAGHGVVPYVELMELKRQNPELLIAKNCQEIRWRKRILVDNRKASDFVMLPIEKPEAIRDAVVEMVAERIPAKYGLDPSEIMVIAPLRGKPDGKRAHQQPVNPLAVNKLNEALRARLNPEAKNFAGIWVGDRVIQRSNDRDLDVVNGDTGTVVEADEKMLTVVFDTPEREVTASRADFDLELAYALTVHKAQGSQAAAVVFVIDPAGNAQWVADAQLTYTAISRAAEICVAVGDKKTLDAQVARHRAVGRWTRLAGMLRQSA